MSLFNGLHGISAKKFFLCPLLVLKARGAASPWDGLAEV